ncbi:unnamed protein product, partial [marine sediment metagenome]
TVFRDLKALESADVPYRYDRKSCRYMIDPGFFLSVPHLSTQEALALLLSVKAIDHIHFPFKDSALRAALKIQSSLPEKTRRYCNAILENISVKATPPAKIALSDTMFAQLIGAILKKRIIEVHYCVPPDRKCTTIKLSPCHLRCSDYTWWVIGKSGTDKRVRTFKLNQINKLKVLDKCFIEDNKFDVHEYLGRAWSMMPENKLYNVKLKFSSEVAYNIAEIQWHSTQVVTYEKDGSAVVEFRVDGLDEIKSWVLGYGNKVQVLAPKILREKVASIAQSAVAQYEQ